MSLEENKAVARGFMEQVLNKHNLANLDQFAAQDIVDHNLLPGLPQGIEGQRQALGILFNAFPDQQYSIDDIIAEGDKVVVRSTLRGTNTGEFMGIPPSGKPVVVEGVDTVRIANGKMVEHWGVSDSLGMMIQMGAVPMPGEAPA